MKLSLLTAAVVVLWSASCSSKPERAIVGKWIEIGGGNEKMELFKDGTITVADMGISLGGKYAFIEENRIKVELGGLAALRGPFVATVSISGDALTWTMPDGKTSNYRRER